MLVGDRDADRGLFVGGDRSIALLATGLALGSLGGLELSIREHFAGYRSHTAMLAGAAGGRRARGAFLRRPRPLPRPGRLAVGARGRRRRGLVLARAFRDRSGQLGKVR